ncbi:MAG: fumarylacetoacetate hydrolase family protein [Saprospiraceae bacterium]|nr:fumarylacetoacetate hydrolase family protein [Saprospiraceae bacterium]
MRIYKNDGDIFIERDDQWYHLSEMDWDDFINRKGLYQYLVNLLEDITPMAKAPDFTPDAPIGRQEIWAAGVTYLKSKIARMEEAEAAGGGDFYNRVYDADRPEIFFKATPARTVGTEREVYIRHDSDWDVPEPELTLFISSEGTIEGYSIGNDMSSRSIEGENPLYLPQAKTYERCAGLGPCIMVSGEPILPRTEIKLQIDRGGQIMYNESVAISQMKRTHTELAGYLYRECEFPYGCFLMTGTCLVPDHPFTLEVGDKVTIQIDGIGKLVNYVSKNPSKPKYLK